MATSPRRMGGAARHGWRCRLQRWQPEWPRWTANRSCRRRPSQAVVTGRRGLPPELCSSSSARLLAAASPKPQAWPDELVARGAVRGTGVADWIAETADCRDLQRSEAQRGSGSGSGSGSGHITGSSLSPPKQLQSNSAAPLLPAALPRLLSPSPSRAPQKAAALPITLYPYATWLW